MTATGLYAYAAIRTVRATRSWATIGGSETTLARRFRVGLVPMTRDGKTGPRACGRRFKTVVLMGFGLADVAFAAGAFQFFGTLRRAWTANWAASGLGLRRWFCTGVATNGTTVKAAVSAATARRASAQNAGNTVSVSTRLGSMPKTRLIQLKMRVIGLSNAHRPPRQFSSQALNVADQDCRTVKLDPIL
jgi:hypothetical protein